MEREDDGGRARSEGGEKKGHTREYSRRVRYLQGMCDLIGIYECYLPTWTFFKTEPYYLSACKDRNTDHFLSPRAVLCAAYPPPHICLLSSILINGIQYGV